MAKNWIKFKRFVARSFKTGKPPAPQPPPPAGEVAVSDRRRRHLISQIASLDGELLRIQRAIDSGVDDERFASLLARQLVRARDVRYKQSLLRIELERGRPCRRPSADSRDVDPGVRPPPREVIESVRELLQTRALDKVAPPELTAEAMGHLLEGSAEKRREAVGFLRALHCEDTLPVLQAALAFDDDWIVVECTGALADFGEKRAVEVLTELLEAPNPRLRTAALRALNGLNAELARKACLRGLADGSPEVRRTATTFLGWHRSPRTAGALAVLLKDEVPAVRVAASEALGQIESDKAILPLIRALGDPAIEVRRAAKEGLDHALRGPIEIQAGATVDEVWPRVDALIEWWAEARAGGPPWRLPDRAELAEIESHLAEREVVPLFARRDPRLVVGPRSTGAFAGSQESRLSSGVGK